LKSAESCGFEICGFVRPSDPFFQDEHQRFFLFPDEAECVRSPPDLIRIPSGNRHAQARSMIPAWFLRQRPLGPAASSPVGLESLGPSPPRLAAKGTDGETPSLSNCNASCSATEGEPTTWGREDGPTKQKTAENSGMKLLGEAAAGFGVTHGLHRQSPPAHPHTGMKVATV